MAGLRKEDISPFADALLLAALFLPFIPVVFTLYLALASNGAGCLANTAQNCEWMGVDLNMLFDAANRTLQRAARLSAGPALFGYLVLVGVLAQFTIKGFRSRVVRTCAVMICAGIMPLVLNLAAALARSPEHLCRGEPCGPVSLIASFAWHGNIVIDWLARIAVPLAVMVTCLLVLTLGYRALVARLVTLANTTPDRD